MDIGAPELLIVLVVILIAFGGKKLPDLARNLGQAKRELEKGMKGDDPQPVAQQQVVAEPISQRVPTPATGAAPAAPAPSEAAEPSSDTVTTPGSIPE